MTRYKNDPMMKVFLLIRLRWSTELNQFFYLKVYTINIGVSLKQKFHPKTKLHKFLTRNVNILDNHLRKKN